MIILDNGKTLDLVLNSTITTNELDIACSFVNITPTTFVPVSNSLSSNGTTTVYIVTNDGITQTQIKFLSVFNNDTVLAELALSSNSRVLFKGTLQPNETLYYVDSVGFYVMDSSGYTKTGLVGPQGLQGVTGIQGDMGATGPAANAPGGSTNQIQYNNGTDFSGASASYISDDGYINMTATPTDLTPPSTGLTIFNKTKANRNLLTQIDPSGLDTSLQSFMGSNRIGLFMHVGNSVTVTSPTLTLVNLVHTPEGTAAARNVGTTSLLATTRRVGYVTTAAVNLSVGTRHGFNQFFSGDTTTNGGFFYVARFGYNTAASGNKGFVGFSSSTGVLTITTEWSLTANTLNCIGFGFDSTDTNWQVFNNDNTLTNCVKTDTGIPKPVAGNLYEVSIFAPPRTLSYSLEIKDLVTNTKYSITLTSGRIPATNTLMGMRIVGNTGSSSSILGLDLISQYIETDF